VVGETEDPVKTINPLVPKLEFVTPRNPFVPLASKRKEFGANGRLIGVPGVNAVVELARVMGTMRVVQLWVVVLQAVELA
jgi:hypothetical protein